MGFLSELRGAWRAGSSIDDVLAILRDEYGHDANADEAGRHLLRAILQQRAADSSAREMAELYAGYRRLTRDPSATRRGRGDGRDT